MYSSDTYITKIDYRSLLDWGRTVSNSYFSNFQDLYKPHDLSRASDFSGMGWK